MGSDNGRISCPSFPGDDFTKSTDVMVVLASKRVGTMLFLRMSTAVDIEAARSAYVAIGLAGMGRSTRTYAACL